MRFVVNRIKTWQDNGGALAECAILYRSNAQSRVLEEALLQASMPYRIYGGCAFSTPGNQRCSRICA
ncbi:3'-5' exonuclease [Escherichia coli]